MAQQKSSLIFTMALISFQMMHQGGLFQLIMLLSHFWTSIRDEIKMKKILLIILLMCFFVVSWVSAECTDTDGGINIYENGEIHFINPYEESANSGSSGGGGNGGTCPSDYTCEDG